MHSFSHPARSQFRSPAHRLGAWIPRQNPRRVLHRRRVLVWCCCHLQTSREAGDPFRDPAIAAEKALTAPFQMIGRVVEFGELMGKRELAARWSGCDVRSSGTRKPKVEGEIGERIVVSYDSTSIRPRTPSVEKVYNHHGRTLLTSAVSSRHRAPDSRLLMAARSLPTRDPSLVWNNPFPLLPTR